MPPTCSWQKWAFGLKMTETGLSGNWKETPKCMLHKHNGGSDDEELAEAKETEEVKNVEMMVDRAFKKGKMLGEIISETDWFNVYELVWQLHRRGTKLQCHEPLLLGDFEEDAHWNPAKAHPPKLRYALWYALHTGTSLRAHLLHLAMLAALPLFATTLSTTPTGRKGCAA